MLQELLASGNQRLFYLELETCSNSRSLCTCNINCAVIVECRFEPDFKCTVYVKRILVGTFIHIIITTKALLSLKKKERKQLFLTQCMNYRVGFVNGKKRYYFWLIIRFNDLRIETKWSSTRRPSSYFSYCT